MPNRQSLLQTIYDLSYVKMGKKSPMTLAHFGWGANGEVLNDAALPASLMGDWAERRPGEIFPSFARLLDKRGTADAESEFSWSVDFAARRARAREEMAPHLAAVALKRDEIVALKNQLSILKKRKVAKSDIEACDSEILCANKVLRETQAKADAIDAAMYDLKAVNPCARDERDTRTPGEVLESITAHGKMVEQALTRLRKSLNVDCGGD
ncbi:MAG: hypothetical protein KGH92_05540 [Xanthomonadaceae bacterium]|nr:hypothetical protein [Xanthomonadaceae bacterium]